MTDFPKAKQPLEAPNREQLTYTQTEEGRYYYAERRFIGDDEYHFYYFAEKFLTKIMKSSNMPSNGHYLPFS